MRRDLNRLASEKFDVHVIGGGATGACIARDAALRGLRVALTEKDDFAHATSAHNSKLVHGGLRYLRNLELGLVRESLRERRIWQRIAPHLVRPLPFLIPLYRSSPRARAMLGAGLALYDALSFDRGWLDDPEQRLPGHARLSRKEALEREPCLDGPGFQGAFLYFDAQMYAPERLALECLIDAETQGAAIANHLEAEELSVRNGRVEGARVRCVLSDARFELRSALTIVAAGPWADLFLNRALRQSGRRLLRSKGIHLLVPALTTVHALTMTTDNGHFFVLPWRGGSLLGTTDTAFAGSPDSVNVSEADIASFLAVLNAHLPGQPVARAAIRHFYAGLRPLVDDGSRDTYGASRRSELVDHRKSDGIDGLLSAIGGKWTTSRALAQSVVDAAATKLDRRLAPCATAVKPLPGGTVGRLDEFHARRKTAPEHLVRLYGARLDGVMAIAGQNPDLLAPLSPCGDIAAQIPFAVREEMALTLSDVLMRRTGIGQEGPPSQPFLAASAALMAKELGWNESRRESEIAAVMRLYKTADDP